jgi:cytochrome c-type biogenesis protein CcmE
LLAGGGAAALAVYALQDNVLFFYSPDDIAAIRKRFPRGGLPHWRPGSAGQRQAGYRPAVHFVVTTARTPCRSIIRASCRTCSVKGRAWWPWERAGADGVFTAREVLAKHDEKYMPPEVVDALKRSGHWQEGQRTGVIMTGEIGQLALCLA